MIVPLRERGIRTVMDLIVEALNVDLKVEW